MCPICSRPYLGRGHKCKCGYYLCPCGLINLNWDDYCDKCGTSKNPHVLETLVREVEESGE